MNPAAKTFPTMIFKGLILFSFLRKALEMSTRISVLYNMAECRDMVNQVKNSISNMIFTITNRSIVFSSKEVQKNQASPSGGQRILLPSIKYTSLGL